MVTSIQPSIEPSSELVHELFAVVEADANTVVWNRLAAGTPDACIEFINAYCKTLNPDLDPPEVPFKLYDYQEDIIRGAFAAMRGRHFEHVDKSRQMGCSWLYMAFNLYGLLFIPGFTSLTLSRKANDVDDGGENSTVESLFGRVRFMAERLPDWMKVKAGMLYKSMRFAAACNPGAFLAGEGAKPSSARHGSYMWGLWDEMAHTDFARSINAGWSQSVRAGVYLSTPNVGNNEFKRLKKTESPTLKHRSLHWRLHPVYGAGAYRDESGLWRSPWYDRRTATMLDDVVARELDISYEGSSAALIYKEWDSAFIVSPDIPYEPNLPIYIGWDFGIGDDTFVEISQINGNEERILRAYAGNNLLPFQHFANIEAILDEIGFTSDYAAIKHYADPSGLARAIASGNSVIHEYEKLFSQKAAGRSVVFNTPRYGLEDGIRACRQRLKAGHVRVSERATVFVDAIEAYQRELDREGNIRPDAKPKHDWTSHPMDGWRYKVTGVFGIDSGGPQRGKLWASGGRPREQWRM